MMDKVCRAYRILPHQFLELDVFEQNLAVLCVADHDAAMAMVLSGAIPTFDIADVI